MVRRAFAFVFVIVAALSLAGEALRQNPYRGAIASDGNGRILFEDSADASAYPASVSKLMTALLVLEDIRAGRYGFDTLVTATHDVYKSEPSWIGLKDGERMSVRDLLFALLVESANDGAIALAVHSAGSLDKFVARMNTRAAELGMGATRYYNPNGLPPNAKRRYPWKQHNVTTARDQLKLALEILKHQEILVFTSVQTCDLIRTTYGYRVALVSASNRTIVKSQLKPNEKIVRRLENHNNIMRGRKLQVVNQDGRNAVDGLKTGYIDDGGSSIVVTALRSGKRVVVVVLGSDAERNVIGLTLKKSVDVRDENARRILVDTLGSLVW